MLIFIRLKVRTTSSSERIYGGTQFLNKQIPEDFMRIRTMGYRDHGLCYQPEF